MQTLTQDEQKTPIAPSEPWNDSYGVRVGLADFNFAERYRQRNHDQRYREADKLYLAWRNRRYWEGTRTPRSALSVWLCFEQIEAMLPQVLGALLSQSPPFDVEPNPAAGLMESRAIRAILTEQLENIGPDVASSLDLREVLRRLLKSSYMYGNGVTQFGYLMCKQPRLEWVRSQVPRRAPVQDEMGQTTFMPTGEFDTVEEQYVGEYEVSRPFLMPVDMRDFYVDPNCPSTNVQEGAYAVTRYLKTVAEMGKFRGSPGFTIPDDGYLIELAERKATRVADTTKQQTESWRGGSWQPALDQTADPMQKRLEVICYWQKGRQVWIVPDTKETDGGIALFNKPNEYHMLPFLTMPYVDVPGRWYGLSICDLLESDQKLGEALLDGRVDELSLLLHAPIIKKAGARFASSQRRMRPGVEWEAEDPKNDIVRMEMGNVTAQAFIEMDALERRAQKLTGVTDVTMGTPAAGGNSMLRTATGVGASQASTGRRIQYLVENVESQYFIPALGILWGLDRKFMRLDQVAAILGQDAQYVQLDPMAVLNTEPRFTVSASSRMRSRQAKAQAIPLILEMLLNPQLQEQLAQQQGKVTDVWAVQELIWDLLDMPGGKSLFRQLTPEEQQAMNQPPVEEMMALQKQRERLAGQKEVAESKDENELVKTIAAALMKVPEVVEALTGVKLREPKSASKP